VGARVGRSITLSSSQTDTHRITRSSLNQGGGGVEWEARKRPEKTETPASCKWFRVEVTARKVASMIQRHATTGRFGLLTQKMAERMNNIRPQVKGRDLLAAFARVPARISIGRNPAAFIVSLE
jgi:hypothetical protein